MNKFRIGHIIILVVCILAALSCVPALVTAYLTLVMLDKIGMADELIKGYKKDFEEGVKSLWD